MFVTTSSTTRPEYEAIVMTFVNPHIASPAYLEEALPDLCEALTQTVPVVSKLCLISTLFQL